MSPRVRRGEKALRAVRPNAGIKDAYRHKLTRLIAEMAKSYAYWLRAQYRATPPAMAQDATPAAELKDALDVMATRWRKKFNDGAPELARYFAKSVRARSERELMAILKKAGYTVRFKMTPAMRDVYRATIEENVGLIKSIPQQFHTQIEGMVMRSVQSGGDLHQLTNDLESQFGVTRRRAEFIARDQNNKATAALTRARQVELGIETGIWMHSHVGKKPRPTHVANDQKRFSIRDGWYDPDPKVRKKIWPGQLPRCQCTWRPVVKGFS